MPETALITQVLLVETVPMAGIVPNHVRIECQIAGSLQVLRMSRDAAAELAAKVAKHLQADGSP